MDAPPRARRALGAVRLAVAVGLLVTLIVQIVDLAQHDALVPSHYFAFFTVESTMLNVVVLAAGGVAALRSPRDGTVLAHALMAIVPAAIVTGLVYNVLLRGLPTTDYLGIPWTNEVLHVVIPLYLLVDWFVLSAVIPGRPRLPLRAIAIGMAYPLLWLGGTTLRGALTNWYPYPFLDPTGPGGAPAALLYSGAIFTVLLALTAITVVASRRGRVERGATRPFR